MTLDEADSVPPYLLVTQPLRFQQKGLDLTIDPRLLLQTSGGAVLERSDLLVLRMIADSWPQRPIYISRTAGGYAEQLGLGRHTLSQGLARKGVHAPQQASADTAYIAGSGWFDLERSRALWQDFTGPDAIVKRNDWVDRPSLSTAFSYLLAGSELAEVMRARGDTLAAAKAIDTVTRVARAVRVEQLLQSGAVPPPVMGDSAR
jgi:hypothetical protein